MKELQFNIIIEPTISHFMHQIVFLLEVIYFSHNSETESFLYFLLLQTHNWPISLSLSKVYNIMIWYMHILHKDYHIKFTWHHFSHKATFVFPVIWIFYEQLTRDFLFCVYFLADISREFIVRNMKNCQDHIFINEKIATL